MTIAKSIYITILWLAIAFSCASHQPLKTPNVAGNIVSFKLVLQWPNSFCSNLTAPRRCRSSVPQVFTIHGFWGADKDDNIVNCKNGVELSHNDLRDLRRSLNENWPSHVDGEDNFMLWRRQWLKHGRCLGLRPSEYFRLALHLKEQIERQLGGRNLVQFFINEGLAPNNQKRYPPQRFPTKIFTKTKCSTQINCNLNSNGEVQFYEVRFCIKRAWQLIDCPYDRYNQYQVSNFYGYGVDSILFPDVPAPPPSPPPPTPPPPRFPLRQRRRSPPPPSPGKKRSPPLPANIAPIPALPPASIPPTQPSAFRRTFAEVLRIPHTLIYSAAPPPTMSPTLPLPPASIPPPPPPFRLMAARGLLHPRNTTRSSTTPPSAFGQDSRSLLGTYLQAALVSIYPCTPSCSTSDLVSTLHYMISRYLKMASRICKKVHRAFSALLCCALLRTWTHHFDRMTRKPITSGRNQGRRGRPQRRSYHWKRE